MNDEISVKFAYARLPFGQLECGSKARLVFGGESLQKFFSGI